MSEESSEDREHAPSQKKLDDARKRGDVVQSADLWAAAAQSGFLAAAAGIGASLLLAAASRLQIMLDRPEDLASILLDDPAMPRLGLVGAVLLPLSPLLLAPAAAVILVLLAARALVFAPEKLQPRLSRIDPVAAARQKFGPEGLVGFAKSIVKLTLVSAILALLLVSRLDLILPVQALEPAAATGLMLRLTLEFLVAATVLSLLAGAFDFLWQHHRRIVRNRMSRQELMEEFKESEGDPHLRMKRRERARDIASNRMLQNVRTADVVIVNPTHFAVALKWKRGDRTPPICVAKGTDAIAARIREIAAESGVPVRQDPPTARALFASVEIGQEIRPEHYAPVAAAIRFAERMRLRARARSGG